MTESRDKVLQMTESRDKVIINLTYPSSQLLVLSHPLRATGTPTIGGVELAELANACAGSQSYVRICEGVLPGGCVSRDGTPGFYCKGEHSEIL